MEGLTEGALVHYVMPDGEHRPAIIVNVLDKETGYCNLQVFTDGRNDNNTTNDSWMNGDAIGSGIAWATSVYPSEDKTPDTWHWIEKA